MLRSNRVLSVAAIVVVFGFTLAASAATVTLHPGSLAVSNVPASIMYDAGSIFNKSADPVTVHAPMARTNSNVASSSIQGYVAVYDPNPNADVTCSLRTHQGDASMFVSTVSTSGFSSSLQSLNFGVIPTSGGWIAYVECKLPGNANGFLSGLAKYELQMN